MIGNILMTSRIVDNDCLMTHDLFSPRSISFAVLQAVLFNWLRAVTTTTELANLLGFPKLDKFVSTVCHRCVIRNEFRTNNYRKQKWSFYFQVTHIQLLFFVVEKKGSIKGDKVIFVYIDIDLPSLNVTCLLNVNLLYTSVGSPHSKYQWHLGL